MMNSWQKALGDPRTFLEQLPGLAKRFEALAGVENPNLTHIRIFLKSRNYLITDDQQVFQATLAAFATLLASSYNQRLRVGGLLRKQVLVESHHFKASLLDLFNRCAFEGLDLDQLENRS